MPNWVFNNLYNYPKELHDKYKGEDTDIDFDKIIPEPEEIKNTVSGSYNNEAKEIYQYNQYIKDIDEKDKKYNIKYDRKNPLKTPVEKFKDRTVTSIGELVIKNPDDSLNTLLSKEENKHRKHIYDEYVYIFGNNSYSDIKDFSKVYDNYIKSREKSFVEMKSRDGEFAKPYKQWDSLADMGKSLLEIKEKYGFDNWYDWRIANWGTKWNACDTEYDEESEQIKFDTAWSIPYPIITKIAQDNPTVNFDGYSEEETGWFDEYKAENGNILVTASGEYVWDEDSDGTKEVKEEFDPPKVYTYEEVAEESIKGWSNFVNNPKLNITI